MNKPEIIGRSMFMIKTRHHKNPDFNSQTIVLYIACLLIPIVIISDKIIIIIITTKNRRSKTSPPY